ncbi:hypothetical protein C8R47DRAFT_1095635 [Mycena vitilis]|nr:hypothetical protein C8R47DRAFT_1095635 [Mycena vitilis]
MMLILMAFLTLPVKDAKARAVPTCPVNLGTCRNLPPNRNEGESFFLRLDCEPVRRNGLRRSKQRGSTNRSTLKSRRLKYPKIFQREGPKIGQVRAEKGPDLRHVRSGKHWQR